MTTLLKYHGFHCCQAIAKHRANTVNRAFFTKERLKSFGSFTKQLAKMKKPYNVVSEAEMAKLTGSVHHEGVLLEAPALESVSLDALLKAHTTGPLLLLDNVQNPHNLGAIMRSCANFGVRAIIGAINGLPEVSPSAARIAEGAIESVKLCRYGNFQDALQRCKDAGWQFIATSSHKGKSLFETPLPPKSIFIMGNEVLGIGVEALKAAHHVVKIPGTGAVESLNVSVATAILIAEYTRQHGLAKH